MKLFLVKLKRLLFTVMFGFPVMIWLLLRDRKTTYFVPNIGLGEYCICLGYLDIYRKLRMIEHVTLLTPPNRAEIAAFFPYWDSHLVLTEPIYLSVACFGAIPFLRFISRRIKRVVGFNLSRYMDKSLLYNNPGAYVDDLLKLVWKIPRAERRQVPLVPEINIEPIVKKYNLVKGKTILFNPFTSGDAVKEIPGKLYEDVIQLLKKEGFSVATITSNSSQRPVRGTQGIATSLAEAWNLVRWCGGVVGTRSGFFDFIRFSGCNIFCVCTSSYKMRDSYSLLPPDNKNNVREYIWNDGNEIELMNNIFSDVCKLSGVRE